MLDFLAMHGRYFRVVKAPDPYATRHLYLCTPGAMLDFLAMHNAADADSDDDEAAHDAARLRALLQVGPCVMFYPRLPSGWRHGFSGQPV